MRRLTSSRSEPPPCVGPASTLTLPMCVRDLGSSSAVTWMSRMLISITTTLIDSGGGGSHRKRFQAGLNDSCVVGEHSDVRCKAYTSAGRHTVKHSFTPGIALSLVCSKVFPRLLVSISGSGRGRGTAVTKEVVAVSSTFP